MINLLAVWCVSYYLTMYFLDYQNRLRGEYIIGAIYVAYFSAPLWLWLSVSAILRRKTMTKTEIVISFIPIAFMIIIFATVYMSALISLGISHITSH